MPGHWSLGKSVHQCSGMLGLNPTKDSKMVPDTALLNTEHYKVRIKSKVKKIQKTCSPFPNTSV